MQTTTATRTYAIDPVHSDIGFSIRHLMIAKVRGRFAVVTGTIGLGSEGDIPTTIVAEIDATSLDTHDSQRDAHVKSADFLAVDLHPVITFTSTAITGEGTDFTATGDLTIHGATKTVTLKGSFEGRGTDPWGNERVGYSASVRISRKDFGLTWNQAMETGGVMIGDDIDVTLDIEAILAK